MTSSQSKRIRAKLARAAELTKEAHELARAGHADYGLLEITARAADDLAAAQNNLRGYDDRMRMNAEAIARSILRANEEEDASS